MTGKLDDLARTLAQPMPRRRALRLLGASLVAATVPGLGPSVSRAARGAATYTCNPNVETCCDEDRRVCHKDAPVPLNKGYCCPAPSWRWQCGSSANGYECVDMCAAKYLTPCTGLRPDKYSGRNGLCCDSRYTVCDPDSDPPLSGGGSRPACKPKTCGPDITDALNGLLARVESRFAGWGSILRANACTDLVTLPGAAIAWDINQLSRGGREPFAARQRPKCSTCGHTVQVGGDCHYSGSVNYALFGVMMRLCHNHYVSEGSSVADWYSAKAMLDLIYLYKFDAANYQESREWASAGYRSSSFGPTPRGDRRQCGACTEPLKGPLNYRWLPWVFAG